LPIAARLWHNRKRSSLLGELNAPPKRMPFSRHRPTSEQPDWKLRLYLIIFESGTRGGKIFDVALLIAIGLSVTVVMLASVQSIRDEHVVLLRALEWFFTILF